MALPATIAAAEAAIAPQTERQTVAPAHRTDRQPALMLRTDPRTARVRETDLAAVRAPRTDPPVAPVPRTDPRAAPVPRTDLPQRRIDQQALLRAEVHRAGARLTALIRAAAARDRAVNAAHPVVRRRARDPAPVVAAAAP